MKFKFIFLMLFQFGYLFAQDLEVTGTVVSSTDGMPLPGVAIVVKGTTNGTATDFDGNFTLNKISKGDILQISYLGYITQDLTVGDSLVFNIALDESNEQLEEVVVTGYSTQKKADITGAVAVVDMDEVNKQVEPNPIKALQGRIPGVQISTDGSPSGGNTGILIRGVGTLNNTSPLFVIDGVPTKSGMHELNPNDIASIQVLKDASSASIYGSRASNGVIIITTKQGKSGKMRIEFSSFLTTSSYANRLDVLNAKEYGEVLWQANINDGLNPNNNNLSYQFDWSFDSDNNPVLDFISVPEFLDDEQTLKSADTDWYDEISQTGFATSYNLNVSNGTEKGNYL